MITVVQEDGYTCYKARLRDEESEVLVHWHEVRKDGKLLLRDIRQVKVLAGEDVGFKDDWPGEWGELPVIACDATE